VELLLNLIWVGIAGAALFSWAKWRYSSSSREAPQMLRGVVVVLCILFLLLPVISITDDLSQVASLAESNRLQDVFKSPELRGIYIVSAVLPAILLPRAPERESTTRNIAIESGRIPNEIFWSPSIERRPPPQLV